MLRRDEESIHDEETSEEVHTEEELSIAEGTEASMTTNDIKINQRNSLPLKYVPVTNALLAFLAKPVVLLNSKFSHAEDTQEDGRGVGECNVHEDVVPPALSEVRQDVLP